MSSRRIIKARSNGSKKQQQYQYQQRVQQQQYHSRTQHIGADVSDAQSDQIVDRAVGRSYNSIARGVILAIAVTAALAVGYGVWVHTVQKDVGTLEKLVIPVTTTVTVYLDGTTGDDTNSGRTPALPVKTLARAIDIMEQCSALECVFSIQNTIDLGANPTVCFFPLVTRCKHITLQGRKLGPGGAGLPVSDVVMSITDIDPASRNWRRITGVAGGYVPNAFQTFFVQNNVQNRIYVVDTNGVTTVDTIAGPSIRGPASGSLPPVPVQPVPWTVGDSFTLFTVSDSITWTGALLLDVPYNTITFSSLIMAPTVTGSYLAAPDGIEHNVVFRGCRLNALSDNLLSPSYQGSLLLQGVYSAGTVPSAFFTGDQANRCIQMESFWADSAEIRMSGPCIAFFFKSSNSPSFGMIVTGPFQGISMYFSETVGGISLSLQDGADAAFISSIKVERFVPPNPHIGIQMTTSSNTFIASININCIAASSVGMRLLLEASTSMHGATNVINAPVPFQLGSSSILGLDDVITGMTITGMTGPAFLVEQGSTLRLGPSGLLTVDMLAVTSPVFDVNTGGRLVLTNAIGNYALSSPANTPLVRAQNGASVNNAITGGALTNGGANPAHVLECGAHPIDPWDFSDHDDPSNVECTRSGFPQPDPQAVRTIFVNAATGSDSNRGTVTTEPLLTIGRAIAVMALRNALDCIIQLEGATMFDLGAEPVLCLAPIQYTCKHIRIVGTETTVGSGTIDAPITDVALGGRNWKQITDTSAAFTPSAFIRAYIRNNVQDRVYIVEDNAATTIDTVTGTVQRGPPALPSPPVPVPESVSWTNGDSFTVFTLINTITWTGDLVIDIPFNKVNFESVAFSPGADDSTLRAPDGPEPRVTFKGCQLDARSSDQLKASYQGSMLLQGVNGEGTIAGAYFTSFQQGRCLQSESLWVNSATMYYTSACAAMFFKSTASPLQGLVIQAAANFLGLGMYIVEPITTAIIISDASTVHMNFLQVEVTTGAATAAMTVATESIVNLLTMTITCGGATCVNGLVLFTGSSTRITGSATISAPQAFIATTGATLNIGFGPTLSGFAAATPPVHAQVGSIVTISSPAWVLDLDTPAIAAPIILCDGCTLNMNGAAAGYTWGTPTGIPLIEANEAALVRGRYTGTLINNGPSVNPTEILICGGNALSNWLLAENDMGLAAGTTEGVNCGR